MEWGPELVYTIMGAAVTGLLGWFWRGMSVKSQFAELKREIAALQERNKAFDALEIRKRQLELESMERKKRLRDYGDLIGLGGLDDD